MSTRTALRQTRWVTFAVLAAAAWTLLIAYEVATAFDWTAWTPGEFVGQTAVSGIVGLVVMALLLGLLITLYSELLETDPSPAPWPPE